MTITLIKLIHTLIFFVLSACVLYILYCGIRNQYSRWTTLALGLIAIEGVLLALNGWQCPLTTLAENLGASQGSVADIFLPRFVADHIFGLCTPLFIFSTALLLARRLQRR
jgi:hypothetical protein